MKFSDTPSRPPSKAGDTPRTDAVLPLGAAKNPEMPHIAIELAGLCRQLERELDDAYRLAVNPSIALERARLLAVAKALDDEATRLEAIGALEFHGFTPHYLRVQAAVIRFSTGA